jgi:hypothetical protein
MLPRVTKIVNPVVVEGAGGFVYVTWMGKTVAKFFNHSNAKTFQKRLQQMMLWAGNAEFVVGSDFATALGLFLTEASSGGKNYKPPLSVV